MKPTFAQPKMQLVSKERVPCKERHRQAGYMLLGVLILASILLIALSTAAPKIATEIQRDREAELYHRGMQYSRAIRLYYKRFGKYPNNLSELEQTNGVRYLRKRYKDPITGGDEWRLIHRGEARLAADNLFRAIIPGGTASAGNVPPASNAIGPSGAQGGIQSQPIGQPGFGTNQSPFGSPQQSSFGGAQTSFGSSQSPFGSNQFGASQSPFGASQSPFGASQSPFGASQSSSGSGNTPAAPASNTSQTGSDNTADNQTFGGLGIVGVASLSPKKSVREYKKQQHYNQWEFTYDASLEIMGAATLSAPTPAQPAQTVPASPPVPSANLPVQLPTADAPPTNSP